jgi:HSP20 family molecular chaperone IbpA
VSENEKGMARREPGDGWNEIDRAIEGLRTRLWDSFGLVPLGAKMPPADRSGGYLRPMRTDVADLGTTYRIVAEIPGIAKDRLDVRVRGSSIEIRGESATDAEVKEDGYVRRERTASGFYRSLELPGPVVGKEAKARVENGLLTLEIPKQPNGATITELRVPIL